MVWCGYRSTAFALLFLLLAEHGLLLFLHLLKTCHEAGFFLGLLGVLLHAGAYGLVLDDEAERVGLHDCDEE